MEKLREGRSRFQNPSSLRHDTATEMLDAGHGIWRDEQEWITEERTVYKYWAREGQGKVWKESNHQISVASIGPFFAESGFVRSGDLSTLSQHF